MIDVSVYVGSESYHHVMVLDRPLCSGLIRRWGSAQAEKDGESFMLLDAASSGKRKDDSFDDLLDFAPTVSNPTAGVSVIISLASRPSGGPSKTYEPTSEA